MQVQELSPVKTNKIVHFLTYHQKWRVLICQFMATAFLLFMVTSVTYLQPFEDHPQELNVYRFITIVIIVYAIICFFAPLTGAHINPAITLAAFFQQRKKKGQIKVILTYWTAQFLGGFLGVVLSRSINGNGGAAFQTAPDAFQLGRICIEQFTATYIFIFLLLLVTCEETTFVYDQAWVHLMIAIFYYFALTIAHTKHYINPAVITSLQFQAMISNGISSQGLPACLFLIISEIVAAILSQMTFRKVYLKIYTQWKKKLLQQ